MNRYYRLLIPIILILIFAIFIDFPKSPGIHIGSVNRDFSTHLGLDLVGGLQALLEADVPPTTSVDPADMNVAVQIVENRVNALGVSEPVVQQAGSRRIVVELPGETDPEKALDIIKKTGLLEFVDMSSITNQEALALVHTKLHTDWVPGTTEPTQNGTPTPTTPGTPSSTPESLLTPSGTPTSTITSTMPVITGPTFHTIMTGADLRGATMSDGTVHS